MTDFQQRCIAACKALILACGISTDLAFEEVEGKRETYFRARLVTAKGTFDLYVYEDEAGTMVVDPQRWFICEVPDYDIPDVLIAAFITKLRGLIC